MLKIDYILAEHFILKIMVNYNSKMLPVGLAMEFLVQIELTTFPEIFQRSETPE